MKLDLPSSSNQIYSVKANQFYPTPMSSSSQKNDTNLTRMNQTKSTISASPSKRLKDSGPGTSIHWTQNSHDNSFHTSKRLAHHNLIHKSDTSLITSMKHTNILISKNPFF